MELAEATSIVKSPIMSVATALSVPTSRTAAPTTGSPDSSVTLPVAVN